MREFIFNLDLREGDTDDNLVRNVDHCADVHIYFLSLYKGGGLG